MDVGIVLDSSGSIGEKNFVKIKKFLMALVSYLNVSPRGTHIAMLHYDHYIYKDFDFSYHEMWNLQKCQQAIANVPYTRGATFTQKALEVALKLFDPRNGCRANDKAVQKILVVITDGRTFRGWRELIKPTEDLKVNMTGVFKIFLQRGSPSGLGTQSLFNCYGQPALKKKSESEYAYLFNPNLNLLSRTLSDIPQCSPIPEKATALRS